LIDFSKHGLDGWRVVPEQHGVVFDRLDDFSAPLKLFLRTVREANVDALHEIHPGQFLDDVLHRGRGEVVKQHWNDHSNRHMRAARRIFFSMRPRSSSTNRVKVGTTFC